MRGEGFPKKSVLYFLVAILFAIVVYASPSFHTSGTVSSFFEDRSPAFTYNFSANVTNPENDTLTFSIEEIKSALGYANASDYYWVEINSVTGVLTFNSTSDNQTGFFNVSVKVLNTVPVGTVDVFYFNVTPVNDAPYFLNLQNTSFNASEQLDYVVIASDEENNTPFFFNVSFISCGTAQWSYRNSTDCVLFNSTYYSVNATSINISFTPTRNDVGSYLVNFTLRDLNNNVAPFNKTISKVVNFTVLNVNSPPYFRYVCNNERNAAEDTAFSCYINASDIDETVALNFSSNASWFFDSQSVPVNSTTQFNGTAQVSFTPRDSNVGNWSINLTVADSGTPRMYNSTVFTFFVANINDSVSINQIANVTAYTTNNYTIYVNASDNDLLIPGKYVYNESLVFSSNTSWVNIATYQVISDSNITTAVITFDPNNGPAGNTTVNISVHDANNFSFASTTFVIQVFSNSAPQWNSSTVTSYSLTEDIAFFLNLSSNVTDTDSITFSWTNDTAFPAFSINSTTGVINITPTDYDVGQHVVNISASDGATPSYIALTFTVTNVNDAPTLETPLTVINASVSSTSNVSAVEGNNTQLSLFVRDNDLLIPPVQKTYYNESLSLTLTIVGPNTNLFSFVKNPSFPTLSGSSANLSLFTANFVANKSDVGSYNITINVSDVSGSSVLLRFNMTISQINNLPNMSVLTNQTSQINSTFFLDINATDVEDGSDSGGNLTFSASFLQGISFLNSTNFNSTTGVINVTFNSSQGGRYRINVTVRDLSGLNFSRDFWLNVYDVPSLKAPTRGINFTFQEGAMANLSFSINHSVGDNLMYDLYVLGVLHNSTTSYGNTTNFTLYFPLNYTEETHGVYGNVTLIAYNVSYSGVNLTVTWNINITHINSPINFSGAIGGGQANTGQAITINLTNYFSDLDYLDPFYNQSINFTLDGTDMDGVFYSVSSLVMSITSTSEVSGTFNITGNDINSTSGSALTSITSNSFSLTFTSPSTTTTSSGGGGHCTPSWNVTFGECVDGFRVVTFKDNKKCFAERTENQSCDLLAPPTFEDRLIFTEELITEQYPECVEAKEMVEQAKKYYENGEFTKAEEYLSRAVDACKDAISQKGEFFNNLPSLLPESKTLLYFSAATIAAVVLGLAYYYYRRRRMDRAIGEFVRKI